MACSSANGMFYPHRFRETPLNDRLTTTYHFRRSWLHSIMCSAATYLPICFTLHIVGSIRCTLHALPRAHTHTQILPKPSNMRHSTCTNPSDIWPSFVPFLSAYRRHKDLNVYAALSGEQSGRPASRKRMLRDQHENSVRLW